MGPYAADIVCKDSLTGRHVLIENQLEKTDHSHLGQILTYAAGLEARTVVWVAARFTDEHRAAIDWLNEITHDDWQFFGLEIELWRIGSSAPAPKFNIICRPNDWSRAVRDEVEKPDRISTTQSFQLRFWSAFRDFMAARGQRAPKPAPQSFQQFALGRTGFLLEAVVKRTEQQLMARLYINCADIDPKRAFRYLEERKAEIHSALGFDLEWNELPERKGCVAVIVRADVLLDDESRWTEYQTWLATTIAKMDKVLRPMIANLRETDLPATAAREGEDMVEAA